MGTAQTPASLATENPEGDDLIVAKAECPPQTPPSWARVGFSELECDDGNLVLKCLGTGIAGWRMTPGVSGGTPARRDVAHCRGWAERMVKL